MAASQRPLLSAGEAFLGSFVASGMGPSASSHGSPVPLPSDLSFRSPTPSNLPMVQLWAAHAHEGKEHARWEGLRAARLPSPDPLKSAPSLPPPWSPLLAVAGGAPALSPGLRAVLQTLSASSNHRHRAFARAVLLLAAPHPHPTGCLLLLLQGSAPTPLPHPPFHLSLVMTGLSLCFLVCEIAILPPE